MAELAGGFVALPGGIGTLEELVEASTWTQLGLHHKPVGVLDVRGYWSDVERQLDHMIRERFLRADSRKLLVFHRDPRALIDKLNDWRPVHDPKWLEEGTQHLAELPVRGPIVGVSAVVVRGRSVLLGRRRGAHGAGSFAFPGGKSNPGESPEAALARELREEAGLEASRITKITWTDDQFGKDGLHFVTLHHEVHVPHDAASRSRA